jgi:nitroreductase
MVGAGERRSKNVDVFEAVRTLLAVRRYQDKPVPDEVIRRIVDSAHLTGSSRNLQPWHFIVVQDKEMLRKLGSMAPSGPYIADASFAVVVVIEESIFSVSDGSRAIQSMLLTAWDEGVGSNWVGFTGRYDEVKGLLGIPAEMEILALLPFGYPEATNLGKGKKNRKPFGEGVHRERFGQPFA